MDYCIENEFLKVTVTTSGAQVKSVIRKSDGVEHMWQADPRVWGYHAPILFPYCGRLKDGTMKARGQIIKDCPQHGFARLMEHTFVAQTRDTLVLQLTDNPETLAAWPWKFRLMSSFTLDGDVLHHTLTVENQDEEEMSFGIGFHPAFAIPFDDAHSWQDYELRFDRLESPLCLSTAPHGLINGQTYYLDKNRSTITLDEKLFAEDSHCMVGLTSRTLGVYEKDSGRGVVCSIREFPYTLIWSKPGKPQFICIEPWNSLPSPEEGGCDWTDKPAAAILQPGETWSTTLSTAFVR